ncbi:MAG: hypothetical protein ACRC0R_05765 [Cetobacterium sp.]
MVSPKDKVRANIYKSLLEEEKKKSKRKSIFSLSVFVVGIFAGTSYESIRKNISPSETLVALETRDLQKKLFERKESGFTIDDLFEANQIKIDKKDFNTENLFVTDLQI